VSGASHIQQFQYLLLGSAADDRLPRDSEEAFDHRREHQRTVEFDLNVDSFPEDVGPFHLEFLLNSEELFGNLPREVWL
jgi:hypothetical protein